MRLEEIVPILVKDEGFLRQHMAKRVSKIGKSSLCRFSMIFVPLRKSTASVAQKEVTVSASGG
jgi:hypothetical protein